MRQSRSFLGQSVCCLIISNAKVSWYPLEHGLVSLGTGYSDSCIVAWQEGVDVRSQWDGTWGTLTVDNEPVKHTKLILQAAAFLLQMLSGSSEGVGFSSVTEAQVTSRTGERGSSPSDECRPSLPSTSQSSKLSRFCTQTRVQVLWVPFLDHLHRECFLWFWCPYFPSYQSWNFSSDI